MEIAEIRVCENVCEAYFSPINGSPRTPPSPGQIGLEFCLWSDAQLAPSFFQSPVGWRYILQ